MPIYAYYIEWESVPDEWSLATNASNKSTSFWFGET